MKDRELTVGYKKKKIKLFLKECNFLEKGTGLMFSQRETAKNLLFSFRDKQRIMIHSFFVFYPFLAIWTDEKNNALEIEVVKPFNPCVCPKKESLNLIEIPVNRKNKSIIKFFFGDSDKLGRFPSVTKGLNTSFNNILYLKR